MKLTPCWSAKGVTTRRPLFLKLLLPGESESVLQLVFPGTINCSLNPMSPFLEDKRSIRSLPTC